MGEDSAEVLGSATPEVSEDAIPKAGSSLGAPSPRSSGDTPLWITLGLLLLLVGGLIGGTYFVFPPSTPAYQGQVRSYDIASVEVQWNYTPAGMDEITGAPFGSNGNPDILYSQHIGPFLGSTFLKCVYQQFPNGSFTTPLVRPADQAYLGILGPVIYAEVGDTVEVHFLNRCRFPESIHPQGLIYSPSNAGTPYNGSGAVGSGGAVAPGGEYNYTFLVPPQAGPGPMDGSSILWTYQSGASLLNSSDTGLTGPIIVTAAGEGNANGAPEDVDQNIILYENIYNEANSPYFTQNVLDHAPDVSAALTNESNATWDQSLLKYAINGYLFGNMPMIELTAGESVRWYVFAFGNDMHSVQWLGNPIQFQGESTDTVPLLPGVTAVADMTPAVPGIWLVQSDDESDLAGGMQERFQVTPALSGAAPLGGSDLWAVLGVSGALAVGVGVAWSAKRRTSPPERSPRPEPKVGPSASGIPARPDSAPSSKVLALGLVLVLAIASCAVLTTEALGSPTLSAAPYTGVIRQYYIAADQVEWNYTPAYEDEVSGTAFGVSNPGELQYTTRNATYLGTSYLKCVYRQYTNGNFTTEVPQPPWLGIMGPTIFASVGDAIQVEFKNNCEFPESVHPHGVFYERTDEGALYNTSSPYYQGEAVPPGGYWNYTWEVPARAGPGPDDGCCVMWMYHSHVDEPVDVNEGLVGSIIITLPQDANPDGTPRQFGEVIALLFNVFDETQSEYETYNVEHDAMNATAVNQTGIGGCLGLGVDQTCTADPTWGAWAESMRKYTVNGYLYGNLPMIDVPQGTQVLWCIMGMGQDFHTAAFDGNDLQVDGMSTDVIPLIPAEMIDGVMWANNTGTFLIDSLTQEDLNGGMEARYTVVPSGDASRPASPSSPSIGTIAGSPTSLATFRAGSAAGSPLLSRWPRWVPR